MAKKAQCEVCGGIPDLDGNQKHAMACPHYVAEPEGVSSLKAALDVNNFTVHFLSLLIPAKELPLVKSQLAAAHAAYREATGEPSFDQQIAERIQRRLDSK